MSDKQKKTAAQRITNLEETLVGTLRAFQAQSNEQELIKQALQLLVSKHEAVVKLLSSNQPITLAAIDAEMVQEKVEKMSKGTADLVTAGVLATTESVESNSFVVGRELMDDGTVVNPRIQFSVESTQPHLKAKILGAKVLDKILVEEGKAKLEVLEIYSINTPTPPSAPAAAPESAPAQA